MRALTRCAGADFRVPRAHAPPAQHQKSGYQQVSSYPKRGQAAQRAAPREHYNFTLISAQTRHSKVPLLVVPCIMM